MEITEYKVLHMEETDEGKVVEDVTEVVDGTENGQVEEVGFSTESFSNIVIVGLGNTTRTSSFTTTDVYPYAYSIENFLIGYNVLAFGDVNMSMHCMGGVLIQGDYTLIGSSASGFADGVSLPPSYVKGYLKTERGVYSSRSGGGGNEPLYVGSSNTVADDHGKPNVNGLTYYHENPKVYISDNYFDFSKAYNVVKSTSGMLMSQASTSAYADSNGTIHIPVGSNAAVSLAGVRSINIVGDVSQMVNTVINITDSGSVNMPGITINGNQPNSVEQGDGTSIVWNLPNAAAVTLPVWTWMGHVIAPDAAVTQNGGNYNGCIICNTLTTSGEGHVYSYRGGGLVPTSGDFSVSKKIDGNNPSSAQKFTFKLTEIGGSGLIKEVQNDGSVVNFGTISYSAAGDYYYIIEEIAGTEQGVLYDGSKFLVHVNVASTASGNNIVLNKTISYFEIVDQASGVQVMTINGTDYYVSSQLTEIVFNNQTYVEKTSVTVTKKWVDNLNQDGKRPAFVEVELLADGRVSGSAVTLNAANNWTYTWNDLIKYSSAHEIVYTVRESNVPADYTTAITGDAANGYEIKNTHIPEKITFPVTKVWLDSNDQDGIRPDDITVQLYANDRAYGAPVTLDEHNEWTYIWNNVSKYADGKLITYRVEEVGVPAKYSSVTTGGTENGFVITNSYETEVTEIAVRKDWNDDNNRDEIRPASVKVQLYADGTAVGNAVTLYKDNNWSYTWEELAKNDDGDAIVYTVDEVEVPNGYTKVITGSAADGFVITNTHEVAKTKISVTKVWVGKDVAGHTHDDPVPVDVQLYADGTALGNPVTLSDSNNWKHIWEELPLNKGNSRGHIVYTVKETNVPEGYNSVVSGGVTNGFIITNTCKHHEMIEIPVIKVWDDKNDQDDIRPASVTVQLFADGEVASEKVILNEANNWSYKWERLAKDENGKLIIYTIEEFDLPEGYTSVVTGYSGTGFMLTNVHKPEETEISVKKVWDDKENQDGIRPASIEVQLIANGRLSGNPVTLDADNNWTYTWEKLAKKNAGREISYDVREVSVPAGYTSSKTGNAADGYVITNTHKVEVFDLPVKKVWYDRNNQDGHRPASIRVQLYANGNKYGSEVTLNTTNHWSYVWNNLPRNYNGTPISYTVKELDVPSVYTSTVTGGTENGFVITNNCQHVELTEISVQKVWDDSNDQDKIRPASVTVQLYADGEAIEKPVILDEANGWSYTWEELAKNDEGKAIVYSVGEVKIPEGYTAKVTGDASVGYVITNTHEVQKTSISVNKVWINRTSDEHEHDIPDSVQVQLYADGTAIGAPVTLRKSNEWKYTWNDLPVNQPRVRSVIHYTVEEINMPEGYESIVSGGPVNGFIITNTCKYLDTIEIPVRKVWDDSENQDGLRPESITVQLYADGEADGEPVVLNKTNDWSYKWEKLEKDVDGELIVYTVKEVNVPEGYKYVITGDNIHGYIITNTHEVEKTEVSVTKKWNDNDNQDGIRPESIKVQLLADGEEYGSVVELKASDNWTYTWKNLAVNSAGKDIAYAVKEVEVPVGYTSVISGTEANGYVITNTHEAEKMDIPVKKVWFDNNDAHGTRPASVEIQLYADGKAAGKILTLCDTNNWSGTWKDLPKYAEGAMIVYTVKEVSVPEGYTSVVTGGTENGFVVTNNCHHVEMTEIVVTKAWNDNNNQDGMRPASVKVQLYANGKEFEESVVLDDANNWTYTWEELALDEANERIIYTVKETDVPEGYTSVVTGSVKEGYVITNTHETEMMEVPVKKVWFDNDDAHGTRPVSVEVQLYANGKAVGKAITLDDGNSWSYVWKELPRYEEGKRISYTLEEVNVPENYTSVITGGTENGFVVTNSCEHIEVTEIPVTKVWKDNNNEKGIRPSSVEVQLYADGNALETPVILDEANNWSYKWEELEKNEDGELIVYTVEEADIADGYIVDITGDNEVGYVLTNTLTSVKISKVDITTQEELEGATIQIIDKAGNVVEEWVSTKEAHEITGLKTGMEYILRETVAPEGYTIAADTTFTIDEEGRVTTTGSKTEDGILLVEDALTSVKVSKVDITTQEELEGATIQIIDEAGNVVEEWVSTKEVHEITGLKTGVEYILRETVAPEGYTIAADTTFTISEDGTVTTTGSKTEDGVLLVEDALADENPVKVVKKLTVVKKVLGPDGKSKESDEVFYAGIFADKGLTKLSKAVERNILELDMSGETEAVSFTEVYLPSDESALTLYIAEVDEHGKPVSEAFGYKVSMSVSSVTFTEEKTEATVTIVNQELETVQEETEKKDSVATGDESPLGMLIVLMASAFAVLVVLLMILIRKRHRGGRK